MATMQFNFYKPEQAITGPAYNLWFKILATCVTIVLAVYATSITLRYPLLDYGFGVKALLRGGGLMLASSYSGFLRSTVTIEDTGIPQRWM